MEKLYKKCMAVTNRYIIQHPKDWILGGEGKVLVVDVYPDGYMQQDIDSEVNSATCKKILCIADISTMPAKVLVHLLWKKDEEATIEYIGRHVKQGSTLVVNEKLGCPRLQHLTGLCCIHVERLQSLDSGGRSIKYNLGK